MTNASSKHIQQASQLTRMRRIATALLGAMACLFIVAHLFEPQYSWLSFVVAFAEAAMVGAIADWFAVTALFRSPFGLPIPHTAIIARNKNRIGSSVADFLEHNFLTQEIVALELQPIDFSNIAVQWLATPDNRRSIIEQITQFLPSALHAIDEKDVISFLKSRSVSLLAEVRIGPLAANIVTALVQHDRHHRLFDLIVGFGMETIENNRPLIRQKIHERSPRWIPQSVDERFFVGLLEEVEQFLEQMLLPDSQWRVRFQQFIDELTAKLHSCPEFETYLNGLVLQGITHPLFEETSLGIWRNIRQRLLDDITSQNSNTARQLDRALQAFAVLLTVDDGIGEKLNTWLRQITTTFIVKRRALIANLVRRVIQSWDGETVSRKFELYIGRDLQYIRINGTIVGGLVGLALHMVSFAF